MDRFIIVLVVVLSVIAIAQLLRVYELASEIKGKREEDISEKDNHLNANLMLGFMVLFYAFFFWLTYHYAGNSYGRGPAASNVAEDARWLLNVNMVIVVAVFLLCNTLLFVFAWKYYYRPDRKAHWFPHSNKLELIWTVIPSIVLAVIIILGLKTWFNVMGPEPNSIDYSTPAKEQPILVELTAEQFAFTTRYAGLDNRLGQSDYKLIGGGQKLPNYILDESGSLTVEDSLDIPNQVGIVTIGFIEGSIAKFDGKIKALEVELKTKGDYLPDWKVSEIEDKIIRNNRLMRRMVALRSEMKSDTTSFEDQALNDFVDDTRELFLIKGRDYNFSFKSKDVIHSAYFPHFDAQMNMVPGATTYFSFTPTLTTEEMRKEMNDPNFDFVLVCNKICGGGHYGMQRKIVVGTEMDFVQFIEGKPFVNGAVFVDDFAEEGGFTAEDEKLQNMLAEKGLPRTKYRLTELAEQWPSIGVSELEIENMLRARHQMPLVREKKAEKSE